MSKDRTWFLVGKKLAGEASADELNELEGLLRSDPDMHYALQNITDLWNLTDPANEDAEDAFQRHINRLKTAGVNWNEEPTEQEPEVTDPTSAKPRSRKTIMLISMAAAILVMAGIYWYYSETKPAAPTGPFIARHTNEKSEVSTRNGSRTKITLPDGSNVWLNAGSKLTYNKDFGNEIREVELSGEAYFDVKSLPGLPLPDSHRDPSGGGGKMPFIIHTRHIDIRVVGTAFNVKSYPGDRQTETSLVHGKVEVLIHNRPDEKIILRPHEKLVVLNDDVPHSATGKSTGNNQPIVTLSKLTWSPNDSILVETAWVENKLVFDNESFSEVAAKMERWYNVQFAFTDQQKKELRFTGVFENENIQQALDYMSITAPFSYTITGNKVIIGR
jgi:transmembrane sensor